MNLTSALRYLDQHAPADAVGGDEPSLERMARLVGALGDPQGAYPVIHVTGTNGKGSVARMISELLAATGLSVGTFTSPHLEAVNEQIARNGEPISDAELGLAIGGIAAVEEVAGVTPTRFEVLAAAAFSWFADVAVDVAVIEVGSVDAADATNVADGVVAVLTNIGEGDGNAAARRSAAAAAAAIVRDGATFVCGESSPELHEVLAATPAAVTWWRGKDFDCDQHVLALGGRALTLRTPNGVVEDVHLPLHGIHQADNAAVALAAVEAFFARTLEEDIVQEGFAKVTAPGRFEIVHREPTVVLDAAGDLDGAGASAVTLREEFTLHGTVIVVVGFTGDVDPVAMLDALDARDAGFVIACTPEARDAIPAPKVAGAASQLGIVAESVSSVGDALARALGLAGHDDLILVTGSMSVVGPARTYLRTQADA